jgi:hypothetical protein
MVQLLSVVISILLYGFTNATPQRTAAKLNAFDGNGWSPAPTAAPRAQLMKRQEGSDLSICGYLDGVSGSCALLSL